MIGITTVVKHHPEHVWRLMRHHGRVRNAYLAKLASATTRQRRPRSKTVVPV